MPFIQFALIISFCLIWAGCSPQTSDTTNSEKTLVVWYVNTCTGLEPAIAQAAIQLEESGAEVSYKACTPLELQRLAGVGSTVATPDVIVVPSEFLPGLVSRTVVRKSSTRNDGDIPVARQACTWQGASWATPLACETRMLFINRNVFRSDFSTASSMSPDDIWTTAQSFTGSKAYFWATHGEDPEVMYRSILSWMSIYEADIYDNNNHPMLTSLSNLQALESYAEFAREGITETERYLDAAFQQGSVGFWYGRASMVRNSIGQQHQRTSIKQLRHDKPDVHRPIVYTSVACVTSRTNNTVLAKDFIERMKVNVVSSGVHGFPTTTQYWQESQQADTPEMALISEAVMNGRCSPAHPEWASICLSLEQAYARVLLGQMSPSQSLLQAQHELLLLRRS